MPKWREYRVGSSVSVNPRGNDTSFGSYPNFIGATGVVRGVDTNYGGMDAHQRWGPWYYINWDREDRSDKKWPTGAFAMFLDPSAGGQEGLFDATDYWQPHTAMNIDQLEEGMRVAIRPDANLTSVGLDRFQAALRNAVGTIVDIDYANSGPKVYVALEATPTMTEEGFPDLSHFFFLPEQLALPKDTGQEQLFDTTDYFAPRTSARGDAIYKIGDEVESDYTTQSHPLDEGYTNGSKGKITEVRLWEDSSQTYPKSDVGPAMYYVDWTFDADNNGGMPPAIWHNDCRLTEGQSQLFDAGDYWQPRTSAELPEDGTKLRVKRDFWKPEWLRQVHMSPAKFYDAYGEYDEDYDEDNTERYPPAEGTVVDSSSSVYPTFGVAIRLQFPSGQWWVPLSWLDVPGDQHSLFDATDYWQPREAAGYKKPKPPALPGPIPFIYDIEQDRVFVGHPGQRVSEIPGRFSPGGIVEGLYQPNGRIQFKTDTDMPYTVRHMVQLWYAMHPELEIKGVDKLQGDKTYRLAASNIGHKVRTMAFTEESVQNVYNVLAPHGNVYVVGGAVRDVVLGRIPKDFDLMVQGIEEPELERLLIGLPGRVDFTGKQFGVFRYRADDGSEVEIAMPRTEVSTGEGRKNFDVRADPYLDIEQDLARRDYTANAMAVNLATGELTDPYGGAMDIRQGKLRTHNPDAFKEDASRILRGLAARSRFGLEPDADTKRMMTEDAHLIKHEPVEQVSADLDKIMGGDDPAGALKLGMDTGVLHHVLPEVAATHGFDQESKYHKLLLDDHILSVLRHVASQTPDRDLRWAALLHDIGKVPSKWKDPRKDEFAHYYYDKDLDVGADHEHVGADMARDRLRELRMPNKRIDRIEHLVRQHMFPSFPGERGARKFIKNVGEEHADDLLTLRWADNGGKGTGNEKDVPVEVERELLRRVREKQQPTALRDLAINGHDLMTELGIKAGPIIGQLLNQLHDEVIEYPDLNNRESLLALAQTLLMPPVESPSGPVEPEGSPGHEPDQGGGIGESQENEVDGEQAPQSGDDDMQGYAHVRESNILDPIQDELDPAVFDHPEGTGPILKGKLARWLKKNVYKVMGEAGWPDPSEYLSLVLTGSLTTYQWAHGSDFDVSLFVDKDRFPDWIRADLISLMVHELDGTIVPGTTHPLQVYVVPPHISKDELYRPGLRSGYDIDRGHWIVPPERTRVVDVHKAMPALIAYARTVEDKMRLLLRFDPYGAKEFWHQVHAKRQRDQRAGKGDYAESNIVYKWLSNAGLFPSISNVTGEYIA